MNKTEILDFISESKNKISVNTNSKQINLTSNEKYLLDEITNLKEQNNNLKEKVHLLENKNLEIDKTIKKQLQATQMYIKFMEFKAKFYGPPKGENYMGHIVNIIDTDNELIFDLIYFNPIDYKYNINIEYYIAETPHDKYYNYKCYSPYSVFHYFTYACIKKKYNIINWFINNVPQQIDISSIDTLLHYNDYEMLKLLKANEQIKSNINRSIFYFRNNPQPDDTYGIYGRVEKWLKDES